MKTLALLAILLGQDVKKPGGLEKVGLTAEQVNKAIDKGTAYLVAHYKENPFEHEADYLAAYALIHTKAFQENAEVREKISKFLRSDAWSSSPSATYVAGIRAMALEATGDPALRALTHECAEYLIETQGPNGTWGYGGYFETQKKEARTIQVSGGDPLDDTAPTELKRKSAWDKGSDGDNSCTQFALLGLHAAAKCGFRAPKETWQRCLKAFESNFNGDGGWGYTTGGTYGSMTCAGVCSIALCRYYLGEKDYLKHDKLKSGIDWLAKNFAVDENPGGAGWALYYLYSVERVGVLCGTEFIGEHEWYPLGAKHLVDWQAADGSWSEDEDKMLGTSFALLFLTRATAPVKKEVKRGGKGWLQTKIELAGRNYHFILDASGSMRAEIDGKEKFAIAQEVVEAAVKQLSDASQVGLRVYGHRKNSLDEGADEDTELVIPVGPLKRDEFIGKVRELKCRGKTPITLSLVQAIEDLSSLAEDVEMTVILLTDGEESTPDANPVEAAEKLVASRKGLKLHVVGFDINNDGAREQLEKTAKAGGGKYVAASNTKELLAALTSVTIGPSEYTLKKDGKEVLKGKLGDRHELPEGKYAIVVGSEEETVWINTEATTLVTVRPK